MFDGQMYLGYVKARDIAAEVPEKDSPRRRWEAGLGSDEPFALPCDTRSSSYRKLLCSLNFMCVSYWLEDFIKAYWKNNSWLIKQFPYYPKLAFRLCLWRLVSLDKWLHLILRKEGHTVFFFSDCCKLFNIYHPNT